MKWKIKFMFETTKQGYVWMTNQVSHLYKPLYTHRIHGAAIYGNIYHQYTPNVVYHTWILWDMDYIYRVLYGCVCPWRLALQKEGWRQQMDEIRAVRTVEQLLFALSWSQKWGQKPDPKTGPQYCRKKERLPKWRPRFWDQGVAYTVSPPLRAVSSGNSGTFRLFSWQWA